MHAGAMFGKYELTGRLGEGGMAEVWKAKISGPDGSERSLVLKRVLPHLARDQEFVSMFVREGQLCSMLTHESIVEVFELGVLDGQYYLAMEYVPGKDLQAVIRARKEPPPPGLAAYLGRELGRALGYAHAAVDATGVPLRIVHRDVTPSNVMLCFDGGVKLVDFGVAKAFALASPRVTAVGAMRGKLGYMSPEQLRNTDLDHRTDLFSIGITLHEALTGRRLFQGDNDVETMEAVLNGPIYEPSRINPAVPAALDAVVMRALHRDRERRFQTGDELADALEPIVWDLGWDRSQVVAQLATRFPEADPAAEPAPARRRSLYAMSTLPDDDVAESLETRLTAAFAQAEEEMGAWTANAEDATVAETATVKDLETVKPDEHASRPTTAREAAPMETARVQAWPDKRKPQAPPRTLMVLAAIAIAALFALAGFIYFHRR